MHKWYHKLFNKLLNVFTVYRKNSQARHFLRKVQPRGKRQDHKGDVLCVPSMVKRTLEMMWLWSSKNDFTEWLKRDPCDL